MNKQQEAALRRAIRAQDAIAALNRSRMVHMIDSQSIVVPQDTLRLIEPDPKKWDYRKAPTNDGSYWATAYFDGRKFECILSEEAHLDIGGYGIQ